jgi:hypothetical protein
MRRYIFALIIILLLVCPLVAQGQTKKHAAASKATAAEKKKKKKSSRKQQQTEAASVPRRLWFTLALSSYFDSNIDDDQESINSFGLVPSAGVHFQDNPEKPSFEADYEVALHRYTNTEKYDLLSHNFKSSYRLQLSRKWQTRTIGEVSLKGSSEDHDVNNQYVLEQQLHYRFNSNNRLRFFAAYRVKRYPLEDVGKNAIDPYIGVRFDQKLKGGRGWEIMYRYDKNRSQDPKDRYVRRMYSAQFHTPLFKERGDLLTLETRYSPRLYARQVKVDGERVPRRDKRWGFDVLYERPLRDDVQMGLQYSFDTRKSNDPEKDFNSHVFGVTFGFKWWRK